jgi:hypothetical protein
MIVSPLRRNNGKKEEEEFKYFFERNNQDKVDPKFQEPGMLQPQ